LQQEGQAGIEYAVLAALLSVASVGVMATLGVRVQDLFQNFLDVFS
jgi:Flp pilus assembly pilin Flp